MQEPLRTGGMTRLIASRRFLVGRQMRSFLDVAVMVVIVRLIRMYISLD